MANDRKFQLTLMGAFDLRSPDGQELRIRSKKGRAIIAILALSKRGTRARVWLQNILWSRVQRTEAQASLRREIANLRVSLHPFASQIITASADNITLHTDAVLTDTEQQSDWFDLNQRFVKVDLLEGIDIPGEENFEEWLRLQRSSLDKRAMNRSVHRASGTMWTGLATSSGGIEHFASTPTLLARRQIVVLIVENHLQYRHRQLENHFFSRVVASLARRTDAIICGPYEQHPTDDEVDGFKDQAVALALSIIVSKETTHLSVSVRCLSSGIVYLADGLICGNDAILSSADFYQLMARTVATIESALIIKINRDATPCSGTLFNNARALTFNLEKNSLIDADQLCARASELKPRPEYIAWRALIRIISIFQHRTDSFLSDKRGVMSLVEAALLKSSNNSTALAISSQAEYLFGSNKRSARQLAEMAVRTDCLDPIAWAALSNIQTACHDYAAAVGSATQAVHTSPAAREIGYFEFYRCMAASGLRDYHTALSSAKTSCLLSKGFAAPKRYMVALTAVMQNESELGVALERLKMIEPAFSLKSLEEPTYPVSTMREISLIEEFHDVAMKYTDIDQVYGDGRKL